MPGELMDFDAFFERIDKTLAECGVEIPASAVRGEPLPEDELDPLEIDAEPIRPKLHANIDFLIEQALAG